MLIKKTHTKVAQLFKAKTTNRQLILHCLICVQKKIFKSVQNQPHRPINLPPTTLRAVVRKRANMFFLDFPRGQNNPFKYPPFPQPKRTNENLPRKSTGGKEKHITQSADWLDLSKPWSWSKGKPHFQTHTEQERVLPISNRSILGALSANVASTPVSYLSDLPVPKRGPDEDTKRSSTVGRRGVLPRRAPNVSTNVARSSPVSR